MCCLDTGALHDRSLQLYREDASPSTCTAVPSLCQAPMHTSSDMYDHYAQDDVTKAGQNVHHVQMMRNGMHAVENLVCWHMLITRKKKILVCGQHENH